MGNWNEQQEEKKETKEKDKVRKEKLAGFFFNLAQVSFTILVLGLNITLTKEELYGNYLLMVLSGLGILLTIMFAKIGNNILKEECHGSIIWIWINCGNNICLLDLYRNPFWKEVDKELIVIL